MRDKPPYPRCPTEETLDKLEAVLTVLEDGNFKTVGIINRLVESTEWDLKFHSNDIRKFKIAGFLQKTHVPFSINMVKWGISENGRNFLKLIKKYPRGLAWKMLT